MPQVRPISTLMVAEQIKHGNINRKWTKFNDIPKNIWLAVLASEDSHFCSHYGIDGKELAKIYKKAIKGEKTRGASTIPMQNAKNLFLWTSRSYIRKGLEMPIAIITDTIWGKKRSMEIYLNIAEWGPQIFGITAAAEFYFGKKLDELNKREITLLIVSLPNPHNRKANKPSKLLTRLAKGLETKMAKSIEHSTCLAQ